MGPPWTGSRRLACAALALFACLPGSGCPAGEPAAPEGGPRGAEGALGSREDALGPFLSRHWQLPVPLQGPVPAGWNAAEASLDPAVCGGCHPKQLAEWSRSVHADAYSPGFAGQLVAGDLAAPLEVRSCQRCHAPLGEQQPFDAGGAPAPAFDPALRARGIACAACHVRAHRRYGPPRDPAAPPSPGPRPHAGFEPRGEFERSAFCAPCHQFFDDPGVAGKPLQNTFAEWRQSPQARAGRSCQSCHMPGRAHTWRGIHDPEWVRSAVDADLVAQDLSGSPLRATLVVRNRDVGHRFPSYVTPRVFLAVWQADAGGRELPDTRLEAALGREVDLASRPAREVFDTRLGPGEAAKLEYGLPRREAAAALVARVSVDPDFHYRGVFASLLAGERDPRARELIAEAARRVADSAYPLAELDQPLP